LDESQRFSKAYVRPAAHPLGFACSQRLGPCGPLCIGAALARNALCGLALELQYPPARRLAERLNWLQGSVDKDPFGAQLLEAGVPEATIRNWSVDPQVPLGGGKKGSLFDQLEDTDLPQCLAKAVELSKLE